MKGIYAPYMQHVYNFYFSLKQLSEEAIFVPGMWGPMQSAVVPNLWVVEGGQSAAGKLVRSTVHFI